MAVSEVTREDRIRKGGRPKGYKHSEESKLKMSEAVRMAHQRKSFGFELGNKELRFTGKTHTEAHKQWLSKEKKLKPMLSDPEVRKRFANNRRGENNPAWKGGLTNPKQLLRSTAEYKEWRKLVFERDLYTCQECLSKSSQGKTVYLNAHHIKEFSKYPELALDVSNGITLCKECHGLKTGHEMLKNKKGKRL